MNDNQKDGESEDVKAARNEFKAAVYGYGTYIFGNVFLRFLGLCLGIAVVLKGCDMVGTPHIVTAVAEDVQRELCAKNPQTAGCRP